MLFGNLYIYFDWNGQTEISGKASETSPDRIKLVILIKPQPNALKLCPAVRQQQEKGFPVPAGRLGPRHAQLPGAEEEPP